MSCISNKNFHHYTRFTGKSADASSLIGVCAVNNTRKATVIEWVSMIVGSAPALSIAVLHREDAKWGLFALLVLVAGLCTTVLTVGELLRSGWRKMAISVIDSIATLGESIRLVGAWMAGLGLTATFLIGVWRGPAFEGVLAANGVTGTGCAVMLMGFVILAIAWLLRRLLTRKELAK